MISCPDILYYIFLTFSSFSSSAIPPLSSSSRSIPRLRCCSLFDASSSFNLLPLLPLPPSFFPPPSLLLLLLVSSSLFCFQFSSSSSVSCSSSFPHPALDTPHSSTLPSHPLYPPLFILLASLFLSSFPLLPPLYRTPLLSSLILLLFLLQFFPCFLCLLHLRSAGVQFG